MTDCFALLDQPRQPWLDLEKLKRAFHEKSLRTHPDARAEGTTATEAEDVFAQINEAYQVLQNPKRRLHHLLRLEGHVPSSAGGSVPEEVADFFPTVTVATQNSERVLQKALAATNPLSRSLLQVELLQARRNVNESLEALLRLQSAAEAELRELSGPAPMADDRLARLQSLYFRFAYLTRWIAELEEKRTQLSTC